MKHWSAGVVSGLVAVVVAGCGGGGDGAVFLSLIHI